MTEQEKKILLIDLCARLPYHPKVRVKVEGIEYDDWWTMATIQELGRVQYTCLPFLRPMSSMTEEELEEYADKLMPLAKANFDYIGHFDWLNAHHFDYRGLIPMGLAIEVTKENNPYE